MSEAHAIDVNIVHGRLGSRDPMQLVHAARLVERHLSVLTLSAVQI